MKKLSLLILALASASLSPVVAQEKWDLRQCIDYALEHNLTIKQREASRDQNEVKLNTAKWSRLPNLSGSASHSFNFGRSLQVDNTYQSINTQNTTFGLNTNIPLFTGMRIPNNISLAKLDLKAAVEDLNKAKEDISIQIASSYLQVLFNEELSKVAHEQVVMSKEMLIQKEEFFKNGKASEAEWYEAKARVEQDQLSAVQADNNLQLALLDLSQLLELPSPDNFGIVSPDIEGKELLNKLDTPDAIFSQAILTKPSIKAAQYRLAGAAHNVKIAKSAYFPQLNLAAGLSTNYFHMSGRPNGVFGSQLKDNFSQFIGFQLNVPIFNRLSTRNQTRLARIQQTTLNWQLEEAKKSLYKEIQVAYYNALGAESRYQSSQSAEEAAKVSFNLMKEKYTYGKATATAYNESRTNWMKMISDQIQAKYDYLFRTKILDFYKGIPLEL